MMFSDKAFTIWMGHAGEDSQVFTADEPKVDTSAFERTQALAIARRESTVAQAPVTSRQLRDCDSEALAA